MKKIIIERNKNTKNHFHIHNEHQEKNKIDEYYKQNIEPEQSQAILAIPLSFIFVTILLIVLSFIKTSLYEHTNIQQVLDKYEQLENSESLESETESLSEVLDLITSPNQQ
jgi:hypothetical protein